MSTYAAKIIKRRRRYHNWLRRLRPGDAVVAHYDGKVDRGCPGVVRALSKGVVDVAFVPWCADGVAAVTVRFRRGEGWYSGDEELGIMRALGCGLGDWYRMRPRSIGAKVVK